MLEKKVRNDPRGNCNLTLIVQKLKKKKIGKNNLYIEKIKVKFSQIF